MVLTFGQRARGQVSAQKEADAETPSFTIRSILFKCAGLHKRSVCRLSHDLQGNVWWLCVKGCVKKKNHNCYV